MADESKLTDSEVFRSKYRKVKVVGKGSFGEAVLVRSKTDGKRYIAKAIESGSMSAKEKRDIQNEIKILSHVDHPNIVKYNEHFEDGTLIFIIMEYADGGDLCQNIKERKKKDPPEPIPDDLVLSWFLQITMAMKYLHDNHVLHRDLKTANIFLTSKNVVKLGDFGISTVLQSTLACAKTVCGTPYYFSPELCTNKPYNNKSDVWALGVILYEMMTLSRPFNAKSLKELMRKIVSGNYEPLPPTVNPDFKGLVKELLNVNPVQRPSINRTLEGPFVQNALQKFSRDLMAQTEKDKEEFKEYRKTHATEAQPQQPQQAPAPAAKPMSAAEQMAMMRGMDKNAMKAMLSKPAPEAVQQEMDAHRRGDVKDTAKEEELTAIDNDGSHIKSKEYLVRQAGEYIGKTKLGGHAEEFGAAEAPANPAEELILMPNGEAISAPKVRPLLEAEMGSALLNKAVDYVSDLMASPTAPSAVEMQRELNTLLGLRFAHNSSAVSKLAMWESKTL